MLVYDLENESMKMLRKLGVVALVGFGLLQLIRPRIPSTQPEAEIQAPPQVRQILAKDCYSCHSDERRLSWFDEIVPGYWLVRHDILTARGHLNFSTLGSKPAPAQKATLFEAVNMIQLGAMPLAAFTALHPDAKVSPDELATLKDYLAPWGSMPPSAGATSTTDTPGPTHLADVGAEFNGLAFEPSFERWKTISYTDRGDNNTFRFILGNDLAVKAARSGVISPWPDGARFAKIAWQQESGADGLIHPGKFVQVEFMVKDSRLYKQTAGWGWGRWRGMDLKPYGKDAQFVGECVSCHMPLRGADYVYTLPLTTASVRQEEVVNRLAATLPQNLPYQPLDWSPITMYVDRGSHAMAVLFGNDEATRAMEAREAGSAEHPNYPAGAVLALVTWSQRDDPHWFGGRIPASPRSVEFVRASPAGAENGYQRFEGIGLAERTVPPELAQQRRSFLLALAPARLP
jgi:mono/diheme cytochrome c family protein